MSDTAQPIKLDLEHKLRSDPEYRRKFFWAESSSLIAKQLIALRRRREMNQREVAERANTKQPAISRAEQADYQNWSFSTIRKIADALNARVRVIIQPAEDVFDDYRESKTLVSITGVSIQEVPASTSTSFRVANDSADLVRMLPPTKYARVEG